MRRGRDEKRERGCDGERGEGERRRKGEEEMER